MIIDRVPTRHYRPSCRRCRDGIPATAPGSARCPHCGGLRVVVLPGRAEGR